MEVATTVGAVLGASLALRVSTSAIAVIFGIVLLCSAYLSGRFRDQTPPEDQPGRFAQFLRMDSTYPTASGPELYHVHHVLAGSSLMLGAGTLSGLLGIGSGALKVIAMDDAMRIPFKVSTTTSNFMIGVTAAASVGLYWRRGYIDPGLAMPVVLGVLLGSLFGAHLLPRLRTASLRLVFSLVLTVLAVEMIYHGVTGRI